MLTEILRRARELSARGENLFATSDFSRFLHNNFTLADFEENVDLLESFNNLDDNDVWASVKGWAKHPDEVLSTLCKSLLDRHLFKISFFEDNARGRNFKTFT